MAEIKWDPHLEIGEKVIDGQHKKLFLQTNKLHDALMKHEGEKVIDKIIDFLSTYVDEHFSYEEEFMEKNDFLGLREHKKAHQDFVVKYNKFKKKLERGAASSDNKVLSNLAVEVQVFLGEWWTNHINTMDQKYAEDILRH